MPCHDFCDDLHVEIEHGPLQLLENTTAYEGTNVVLHCSAQLSVPTAKIMWTHNGQALALVSDDRLSVMLTGNLYIVSVGARDGGVYQCVVTNLITLSHWRSSEAMLTILGETKY